MTTFYQRHEMAEIMDLLVLDEPEVHYRQIRPMSTREIHSVPELRARLEAPGGISMDCSEAVTLICKLAHLRDPNGRDYNGTGFTGTMLEHLPHYENPAEARIGALVVFGPAPGDHVCMVRRPGANPLLFSHGFEGGPILASYSLERKWHRAPAVFLDVSAL